jgi:hypothetical protein
MRKRVEKKSIKGFAATELATAAALAGILTALFLAPASNGNGTQASSTNVNGVAWVSGQGGTR